MQMIYIKIMTAERKTKYTQAAAAYIRQVGHATNAQILTELQAAYPDLSATTVHRITVRMVERGELAHAPIAKDNVSRFDHNVAPHDHFHCSSCDRLRDVALPKELFAEIQLKLGDCKLDGNLTVQGSCTNCIKINGEQI